MSNNLLINICKFSFFEFTTVLFVFSMNFDTETIIVANRTCLDI